LVADAADVCALAVLGHHGGLSSIGELEAALGDETEDEDRTLERFFGEVPEAREWLGREGLIPAAWRTKQGVLDIGIRMVFAALVDADFLDTSAHFRGEPAPVVGPPVDWAAVVGRFESARARLLAEQVARRGRSPVDADRAWLYERVVGQAGLPPGVFRLPAPTGSGKTITAGGFAVHHAAAHGRSRVVVAVPFLTITEQNAQVYRDLLGEDMVLEHHSQAEYDDRGDHRARLLAENWDAPFVVTTTVQLFDSLFGRRPARSRKLHRLANAVLVLDEVQALPQPLLVPILDALRVLSEHFGTTVLLTSATQPTFEALGPWKDLTVRDLLPKPDAVALFTRLKRVRYEWQIAPRPTLAEVADQVAAAPEQQVLVVVNTIDHARAMFGLLAERTGVPVRHLSTRMCPQHRRNVLAEVAGFLADRQPVLLVSTQLIEAGVDVDFPVVFRALAPAESLQQAAGRANREGALERGRVVVFDAVDAPVPRFYALGVESTRRHFGPGAGLADPDDVRALSEYYRHLYGSARTEFLERAQAIQTARAALDFRAVADGPLRDSAGVERNASLAFRMIDDDTVPVVITRYPAADVPGEQVEQWVSELADPARRRGELFPLLRPFTVSLPRRVVTDPRVAPMLTPIVGDLSRWDGTYDDYLGLGEVVSGTEMVL
jgi:CRISPR-associated endonuclease/helicase Cas3